MALSSDTIFCGRMHVRTATWIIAAVHLVIVGYIWLIAVLHHFKVIDKRPPTTKFDDTLSFHGIFGDYGNVIGATIWLVFILMLIYGLHTRKAVFVLAHLIACAVMIVILIANVVTNIVNGDKIDYWLPTAIIAAILVCLLYIEYRCYEWLRGASLLPH